MARLVPSPPLFRLFVLCSCALAAKALSPSEKLAQFSRQNWQTENGLPQNTVHAIFQASNGFLWVGTDGGLVRFDGARFTTFDTQNTPGMNSNNVQQLAQDVGGALWFSTPEGVTRLDNFRLQNFTPRDGLPPGRSWSLLLDSSSLLYVSSSDGSARFSAGRFLPGPIIPPPFVLPASLGRLRVFLRTGAGLWLGTDRGLCFAAKGKIATRFTTAEGLPSNRVTALLHDRQGALWVGTEAGIARVIEGKVDTFPHTDVLATDAVNAIFEDREGNIWIGGDTTGLTILRQQKFVTYSFRDASSSSQQIRCIFGSRDGAIWLGTDGAGLKRFYNGKFSTFTTADGLSSNVILSLGEKPDGTLLAGTPDGLNLIQNTSISTLTTSHGLAEDFVRSLYSDSDGSIWVGTRRGLSHISKGRIASYTQSDGLGSDTVGALLRDNRGTLWIGTLHGLSRLDSAGIKNFTTAQGLSGNIVTDLYQDSDGSLWIATQDGGLNRYRDGLFTTFPPSLGLPETIYGITSDSYGNLWLAAKTGIFRVNRRQLETHTLHSPDPLSVVAYGTSDGLRVSEGSGSGHPAVWKTPAGDLWFATAKGAALLSSAGSALNRVPPPVALETVSIDDAVFRPNEIASVPPGHSRVSFEYAGLSFVAPSKVQYKYRLEGFDKNWIDAGTRRVAYYTNLPPKSYRFHVIARNNDGFWNETGASFPIRILPRFYQTWWFYLLLLCAAALAAYGLYLSRLRQVQSRFEAVLSERNRIAREIHDTLAQGFVAVSVQLELVSRFLSASSDSAREHLDQARIMVRSSLSDARQSIWELRSHESGNHDFAGRFSKLAQQLSDTGPAKVQLQVHGQYRALKPVVEDELFRIGQEAIHNAVRHSGALHIRVELTFDARKLRMTVADNGRGFSGSVNSQGPDGHFGLKGMRERAKRIHAELNIESSLGSGTTVSVEAPAR